MTQIPSFSVSSVYWNDHHQDCNRQGIQLPVKPSADKPDPLFGIILNAFESGYSPLAVVYPTLVTSRLRVFFKDSGRKLCACQWANVLYAPMITHLSTQPIPNAALVARLIRGLLVQIVDATFVVSNHQFEHDLAVRLILEGDIPIGPIATQYRLT